MASAASSAEVVLDRPDIIGPWVYERFPYPCRYTQDEGTAIGLVVARKLVAGCTYSQYNGVNVWCAIAAEQGARWFNRSFLFVLFDYPFRQLGVKRISVAVDETNRRSQDFVTRLGFELETRLAGASPGGDLLIYRMTREACPWLARSPRHQQRQRAFTA